MINLIEVYKKFGNPEILLFAYDRKQKKYVLFDGQDLKEFDNLQKMKKFLLKKFKNQKLGCMPKIRFILDTVDGSLDFIEYSLYTFLSKRF